MSYNEEDLGEATSDIEEMTDAEYQHYLEGLED